MLGHPVGLDKSRQGLTVHAVGASGGCLDIFSSPG